MANWLDDFVDAAGNVMDVAQDVIDTARRFDSPATPPIATPAPSPAATPAPVAPTMIGGLSQESLLVMVVVAVLAIVLLR